MIELYNIDCEEKSLSPITTTLYYFPMRTRKRPRLTGRPRPPRGVKSPRRNRFAAKLQTTTGIKVRSRYEQQCVKFLLAHDLEFQYEPLILLAGRQYRPDFFLPQFNLFLEICGYGHMPFYRDRVTHKKKQYAAGGLNCMFISYNGKGSLEKLLRDEFTKAGLLPASIPCHD